ncbi:hypothetical protein V9K67_14885 [Paraflavisolibacter sp. H34]|uniref:hypothetical protein n=1 Tax=Huijunlia imazamoxiresistens TaxID=3127457 RepID=UPI0030168EAA
MVHANELRIGNKLWLCRHDGSEPVAATVAGLQAADGKLLVQTEEHAPADVSKDFRPIHLTEAHLEGCGFKRDEIEYIGPLWHLHPVQILDEDGLWLVNDKLRKRLKLHSLHQLQNLFFALTGKELEVTRL